MRALLRPRRLLALTSAHVSARQQHAADIPTMLDTRSALISVHDSLVQFETEALTNSGPLSIRSRMRYPLSLSKMSTLMSILLQPGSIPPSVWTPSRLRRHSAPASALQVISTGRKACRIFGRLGRWPADSVGIVGFIIHGHEHYTLCRNTLYCDTPFNLNVPVPNKRPVMQPGHEYRKFRIPKP